MDDDAVSDDSSLAGQPFGDEDAAAMGPERVLHGFVGFDADPRVGGLGVTDADARTLLFVGGRGSGRTTYLERARLAASMSQGIHVLDGDNHNPPESRAIRDLCEAFPRGEAVKGWQMIWRAAILRSLTSHLLYDYALGLPLETDLAGRSVADDFVAVLEPPGMGTPVRAPAGVYSQVTAIYETFRHSDPSLLARYLRLDDWEKLEGRIAEGLREYRPIGIYLDGLDREFRHAPMHWLTCEKALFYQVLHFNENQRLRDRLRIVASVRDLAYSMVRQGDSQTKYPARGRIRSLDWSTHATREFLREKIRRLSKDMMFRPELAGDDRAVEGWLGTSSILNERRGQPEHLEDYLISHTLGGPRDIVVLGNDLSRQVAIAKLEEHPFVQAEVIRQIVEHRAQDIARGRLSTAAAELVALTPPEVLMSDRFNELAIADDSRYEAVAAFQAELAEKLEDILRKVGCVAFTREAFAEAFAEAAPEMDGADVLSALWRTGILGYVAPTDAGPRPVFYSSGARDRLTLPDEANRLWLHRCMIDVADLEPPTEFYGPIYE
jgi:hypothetical protein